MWSIADSTSRVVSNSRLPRLIIRQVAVQANVILLLRLAASFAQDFRDDEQMNETMNWDTHGAFEKYMWQHLLSCVW